MKAVIFLILFLYTSRSYSQNDTSPNTVSKLDTIESYTNIRIINGPGGFFVNDKRISKREYDRYSEILENTISKCRPCWIKNYTLEGILVSEGAYYSECLVGVYIEYYENGVRKIIGHYKENFTGNWANIVERNLCAVRHGLWTYFNRNGAVYKTENYIDGKLVN
jgi:antitoxin component YwqK of YwqJK toxin-antitoxin module